jgi:hypothetical protein
MARLESQAVGGYFPTPLPLLPSLAGLLEPQGTSCVVVDPCAGDGEAVVTISKLMGINAMILSCEMEATRHKALKERMRMASWASEQRALHGDAFLVDIDDTKADVLFLNPPYDLDSIHGRLEQRFLDRFTVTLKEDGVLMFLVPFYALKASALTLATHYDELVCLRFPTEHFEPYRQVALMAKKVDRRLEPDRAILAQVAAWAESVDDCPVLGTTDHKFKVQHNHSINPSWSLRPIDLTGLLKKFRPWQYSPKPGTTNPIPHVLPEVPIEDLLFRTFTLATSPRPAHIAAGIASGLFNGRKVTPKTDGLPELLVKGVFDREYVTIEEKHNKDGDVTAVVQVQQPKLVTTVLDLSTKKYTTLKPMGKGADMLDVANMSIEGLLEHYGPSLMRVMNEQCPVLYDPQRDAAGLPIYQAPRPLYEAQKHAAKALLKLLGGPIATRRQRQGKAAIFLGEIGSGKTSVALSVGKTIGRRMLVMCPPHLLQSWTDETLAVIPDAEIRILQNIHDVDALENVPADKFLIAVLSRETAKLGHGWESVTGACPKCGAQLPVGDLAKKRMCCMAEPLSPHDEIAKAAHALALRMVTAEPSSSYLHALLNNRHQRRYLGQVSNVPEEDRPEWKGFDAAWVEKTLTQISTADAQSQDSWGKLLGRLLVADYQADRIAALIKSISASTYDYQARTLIQALTMLLPPGSELQEEARRHPVFTDGGNYWSYFPENLKQAHDSGFKSQVGDIKWKDGQLTLDDCKPGSLALAQKILSKLSSLGRFSRQEECGEPLFQAVPEPRRYPLSRYITKRFPKLFDFMVLDEGHEYATDGSAQERSAHRLTALGIPTVLMTGSIMNGYAESLFTNMWALSSDFRNEFGRDERQRFIDRYGYRKRVLTDKDKQTGEILSFGAHTDRVERTERTAGDAPGILPLFLFRHLLPFSVTLHKADLSLELPPCRQIKCLIKPDADLFKSYQALQQALIAQIRKDQFKAGFAGKLFGALAELPSYLDRATLDTGNQDDGSYEIHYPESIGGGLVARGESYPAQTLTSKEEWMLETVRAELAEGRNVMVFCWHVRLLPRLARIIKEAIGEEVPILYADKVATGKRQEWITKNVVKKNRRVLVANPVAIQTGLNNLVHFATEIWMENPAVNPIITRQAIGRVDRIGQKQETRIYFPIYEGSLQVPLYDLLMRKIAVSVSTDGLDPESVLLAAGAAEDGFLMGLSIGKQLWNMLNAN